MIKEAIEKIEAMTGPEIVQIDGHNYAIGKDDIREIRPEIDGPETLNVNSLDAVVNLIRANDGQLPHLFVCVAGYGVVNVFGDLEPKNRFTRKRLYHAAASDIPGWEPKMEMGFDEATVALLTRFQDGGDKEYVLRLLSQITTGAKVTYSDNGIASTMVMTKGASLAENVTIKPIVKLRPYRTFLEVEQPEGLFLIRIRERGIAFIEADGGMWKLAARNTIKAYLEAQLKDCNVTIML